MGNWKLPSKEGTKKKDKRGGAKGDVQHLVRRRKRKRESVKEKFRSEGRGGRSDPKEIKERKGANLKE